MWPALLIGRTERRMLRAGAAEHWQQVELSHSRYELETTSWSS